MGDKLIDLRDRRVYEAPRIEDYGRVDEAVMNRNGESEKRHAVEEFVRQAAKA